MHEHEVDVVVVGMGPGGEDVAGQLAAAGLSVVGVESHLVGGECPYYGCIPSKMIIRAADLLEEARRVNQMAGMAIVRMLPVGLALVGGRPRSHLRPAGRLVWAQTRGSASGHTRVGDRSADPGVGHGLRRSGFVVDRFRRDVAVEAHRGIDQRLHFQTCIDRRDQRCAPCPVISSWKGHRTGTTGRKMSQVHGPGVAQARNRSRLRARPARRATVSASIPRSGRPRRPAAPTHRRAEAA